MVPAVRKGRRQMDQVLSVQEVARRLGISPRGVVATIKSGRLKARHIGREWIIEVACVDAFAMESRLAGRPKAKGAG
jgi:excisionase family DNA binding protein